MKSLLLGAPGRAGSRFGRDAIEARAEFSLKAAEPSPFTGQRAGIAD